MAYVVLQIVVFSLLAAVLGFVAGWMLRGWGLDGSTHMSDGYEREQREALLRELNTARAERDDARTQMLAMRVAVPCAPTSTFKRDSSVAVSLPAASRASPSASPKAASTSPVGAVAPAPTADRANDLKRIKGVGPKLEQTLLAMGISRFAQIAAWTDEEVAEVNAKLRFHGRIERDQWIAQARTLAAK